MPVGESPGLGTGDGGAGSAGTGRLSTLLHNNRGAVVEDLVVINNSANLQASTIL